MVDLTDPHPNVSHQTSNSKILTAYKIIDSNKNYLNWLIDHDTRACLTGLRIGTNRNGCVSWHF
jgi:hypothetical protein